MQCLRIGMIGAGYIGRSHAIAYAQAPVAFPLPAKPVLELLAESTPEFAAQKAREFGFSRSTGNWRELVADPSVDIVDICVPNFLHKEIAFEAMLHGKHVYCEKPLALTAAEAGEMVAAANQYGVKTLVGFNYIKNPTTQLAKQIIQQGEIGKIVHFYGTHNEDYLASPASPRDWHCIRREAGLGALGDLGAHIVNMAHYLVGDIARVCGTMQTVITQRPDPKNAGHLLLVENEDQASAMLHFANGAQGVIETSRIACGSKMGLAYVVTGTKGTIRFTQERMAELKLYLHDEAIARQGFKTILTGPAHPDYAAFCVSAGHGIGFNDQKTVEIRDLIAGCMTGAIWPDFEEGWRVSRVLDAIARSALEERWVSVSEI